MLPIGSVTAGQPAYLPRRACLSGRCRHAISIPAAQPSPFSRAKLSAGGIVRGYRPGSAAPLARTQRIFLQNFLRQVASLLHCAPMPPFMPTTSDSTTTPQDTTAFNPMDFVEPLLQFFVSDHLPARLQPASLPFETLAKMLVVTLPRNPERTVALRKLLEAKDCAVRALLYT